MNTVVQEDGTLESIVEDQAPLELILGALCGVTKAKEQDTDVRVALTESTELLVSQQLLHVGQLCNIQCITCPSVKWNLPCKTSGIAGQVVVGCSFLDINCLSVSTGTSAVHASTRYTSTPALSGIFCRLQVATQKGSQVLWDLKAPEMLRKGYAVWDSRSVPMPSQFHPCRCTCSSILLPARKIAARAGSPTAAIACRHAKRRMHSLCSSAN